MIPRKLSFLLIFTFSIFQTQISEQKLDVLVQETLKTFDVPGISVGILKDGKLVYAKGHGVRSLKNNLPMNENTLVGIASNSKGFTCFALAMLADEGKLNWDDRVMDHLPNFRMHDSYVTEKITIKDLVTHRSGLGLGQGDLMFFPEGGSLTVDDIIHNIRHLELQNSFRNTLDYNNIMFIVAGKIIEKHSGLSWAEFIEQKILYPVGMNASYGSYNRVKSKTNIIDAHAPKDGKAVAILHDWNETANAAGGIMSNINDMAIWAEFLMNNGVTKSGKRLISEKQISQLFALQFSTPVASRKNPYNTSFNGYGLGWFINDTKGYKQISHTGGLLGTVTQFTLIPEINLGIVVLTNQQSGAAFTTITNTIKDSYLGYEDRSWLQKNKERVENSFQKANSVLAAAYEKSKQYIKSKESKPKESQIVGTYKDKWFGKVQIKFENKVYRIVCESSPKLSGELLPHSYNTFIVKWDDRTIDADAYLSLAFDEQGIAESASLKAISPLTDFSFDFQDLKLQRLNKADRTDR